MVITRYFWCAALAFLVAGGVVGQVRGEDGGGGGQGISAQEYAAKSLELRAVETRLKAEREELGKLRHRWVVAKGRTPTKQEIADFEEQVAKGKATPLENPYYNKTPLSTPAPARSAYFTKLDEVRRNEERVRRLKEELAAFELKGARGGERR